MKITLLTTILALAFPLTSLAKRSKFQPLPKNVEEEVMEYIKPNLFISEKQDLGDSFSTVFKGVIVYDLWRGSSKGKSKMTTGMGMFIVSYKESIHIFENNSELMEYLFGLYKEPLKNSDDIKTLFEAIGPVKEVIKVDEEYHIFSGDKFFKSRSGYRVTMKDDGKIDSFKYENKLAKKPQPVSK